MKVKIKVPIYDVILWIIISKDPIVERKKMEDLFGPSTLGDFEGLCSYSSSLPNFALFFRADSLFYDNISHEVFHLTHRILDFIGSKFDVENQECAAYLNGYLMNLVMEKVITYNRSRRKPCEKPKSETSKSLRKK